MYGWGEVVVKVAPLFISIYAISKFKYFASSLLLEMLTVHHTPERDEFLIEDSKKGYSAEVKRESF